MLCSRCEKNPATVYYKQLIGNDLTEYRVCADCAKAVELPAITSAAPIFDLLSALGGASPRPRTAARACARCGLRYSEFRKTGMFGCADCYGSFADELKGLLKDFHGAGRHGGKAPIPSRANSAVELARLRRELDAAIKRESFEEAARLRDAIERLGK